MAQPVIDVEYEQPAQDGGVCSTHHAWARVPPEPSAAERAYVMSALPASERPFTP